MDESGDELVDWGEFSRMRTELGASLNGLVKPLFVVGATLAVDGLSAALAVGAVAVGAVAVGRLAVKRVMGVVEFPRHEHSK